MVNSGGLETVSGRVGEQVGTGRNRAPILAFLSGLLLTIGSILVAALIVEWFAAYFTIWTPVTIEDGEVRLYEVTAALCLSSLAASVLLAVLAGRHGIAWSAGTVLVIGVVVALLFSVPTGRWSTAPEPGPSPLPSNYEPCYSGSNDCGGGG